HYVDIVGLVETNRDDTGVYLKAWDEQDAYSVILRQADRPGMDFYGFKVRQDSDLDHYQSRLEAAGVEVKEIAAGDLRGCGRRLQFQIPTGQTLELFAEKAHKG